MNFTGKGGRRNLSVAENMKPRQWSARQTIALVALATSGLGVFTYGAVNTHRTPIEMFGAVNLPWPNNNDQSFLVPLKESRQDSCEHYNGLLAFLLRERTTLYSGSVAGYEQQYLATSNLSPTSQPIIELRRQLSLETGGQPGKFEAVVCVGGDVPVDYSRQNI